MAKYTKSVAPRSKKSDKVEKITEEVVVSVVEETIEEVVVESVVEETIEEVVVVETEEQKKLFTMDITEFGVKFEDAEKFVKTAIRFYFENKDKKNVVDNPKEVQKNIEVDQKSELILSKIKKFENGLTKYQFLPKKMVMEFIKDLKE